MIDQWRCVLGLCLVLAGYCFKARKEEAMLTQQFGDAFREHQKHTGFLIHASAADAASERISLRLEARS